MKNNLKVILGTVAGIMLGGITVVGANQAIQAMQNTEIKVSLNGQVQEFKDETTGEVQYPITYNNRTYLPLRNVAQLAGLNVDYDSSSNMAILDSSNDIYVSNTIISDCKVLNEEKEQYEDYVLISKRLFEFNYKNHLYSFTLGEVWNEDDFYIKDNNSGKVEFGWQNTKESTIEDYAIGVYDFNKNDEDIQLIIAWGYEPGDGPAEVIYNVRNNDFYSLGLMPYYEFITTDGRLGRYISWINEKIVSEYYEIVDGKMMRLINIPDRRETFTVNEFGVAIIQDKAGNSVDKRIESGEKIRILSVPDNGWFDCEIERENGDIVIVGQEAGRVF